MSNGVQYNISFNEGNSSNQLTQLITLMTQSVAQTTALQAAISSLNSSAVTAIGGVESAVKDLSGSVTSNLNPAVHQTGNDFDTAGNKAITFSERLEKVGKASFYLNNIRQAISGIVDDLNRATKPGIDLNTQLKQMQAITGIDDHQLRQLSDAARDNAKAFGVDAAQGAAGYQVYLAGLGPAIGQVPEALAEMGKDATILSKQMEGDVKGAAGALTTAVQQFGVSLDDPIKASKTMTVMMNIMAAASREGSAELPDLKSALEQAGMMAKTANVSFAETNAALELLANRGKKGAEGGVALRNVMSILSEGTFLPPMTQNMLQMAGINVKALGDKTLSLSERLKQLQPIANDTAAMTMLFGRENVAAGIALVQNAGAVQELTGKITGTNAAVEQANIVMDSYQEKQNRLTAAIQDFGISIFNATGSFLPFIVMGMGVLSVLANLAQASTVFSAIATSRMWPAIASGLVTMGSWIAEVTMATLAQLGLNAAMSMNPIGAIVIAVAAAVGAIIVLTKYWHQIWDAVKSFGAWVWEHNPFRFLIDVTDRIFPGFKKQMSALWDWVIGKFEALIGWFKKAWGWIKKLFSGGKDDAADASKAAVDEYRKQLDQPIPGITVAAAANNDSPVANFKRGHQRQSDSNNTGKATSSNISSGGSRPTTINITIQKLQDQIVIQTLKLQEGAKEAADKVVNELLMALNSIDGKSGGVSYGN